MMSFKQKIARWIQKKQADIDRGREITLQLKDEKARRKQHRLKNMKEGSWKTIQNGLAVHASPMDVMREEYNRRKHERTKNRK